MPAAADVVDRVLHDPSLLGVAVQPVVDLMRGEVAGWEALSRPAPFLGTDPRALFDLAAATGRAGALHVVALRTALALRPSLPHRTFLTVNVDPAAVLDDRVRALLASAGDLRGVFVEITELDWPDDADAVVAALRDLQAQGAMVAMDDVGAGYAGLTRLLQVRPQLVKLDRDLVRDLGHDPAAQAVVRAVGELSSSLDAWVLVEGVERADQVAAAIDLGVPLGQGYLLGRPAAPWPVVDLEPVRRQVHLRTLDDSVVSLLRAPEVFDVGLDDAGRPVDLADQVHSGSLRRHPALTMAPSTSVRDALDRALTRPASDRFTPVLITSCEGALLGGVRMEDLVRAATSRPAPSAPRPLPRQARAGAAQPSTASS